VEPLRRTLETIRKYLGRMSARDKLVIGLLCVILGMALLLVFVWSSAATMTALMTGATTEEQQRAIPILQGAGIKVETRNGQLFVPEGKKDAAWALIVQAGQQPSNSALIFDNLLKSQNWINSKEQNRQIYQQMLNNFLSSVISKFDGVRSAKVFVDAPEAVGIGQAARPPKASITIFTEPNKPLTQAAVDAAARMVAGSVAGLDISRVSVTDGAGRPRKVTDDAELASGSYRENAAALEKQFREKIYNLVRYIDGVVVEVTATLDNTKSRSEFVKNLPVGEGTVSVPKKENSTSNTQTDASTAAEPGVRSNVQANIATASGSQGSRNDQKQEDTEFAVGIGTEKKQVDDPGGMPTRLVATVAVPRGFIAALLQKETAKPAGADKATAPTNEQIQKRFQDEEASIKKALAPHVKTRAPSGQVIEGEIEVTLVSGDVPATGGSGPGSTASVGGGLGTILALGEGMIDKVVLGALALLAVGMMLMMVRRAGRKMEVPTAEELVGAPPQLQAKDDLVGEADESETAIAGIELGEDQIRADKIREQVADLVKSTPDVAAKMLNRWIAVEE
jgi:flagellar M-ring protein FliF